MEQAPKQAADEENAHQKNKLMVETASLEYSWNDQ